MAGGSHISGAWPLDNSTTQTHNAHAHELFFLSLSLSVFTIAACIATDWGGFFLGFFWGVFFGTIGSEHYPPSYDIFFLPSATCFQHTRTFNFRFGSKIRKGGRGLHHWRIFLLSSLELREAGFFFRRGAALMGMAFHHSTREEQDFITALGKVFR